jgi:hypothetical protein
MGIPGQNRQEKVNIFLVKMPLWYILSIPKCRNIVTSALKLPLVALKLIEFQYNSFIETSKISKNHFFPSFPRPTFQNVITHKIFEILWCPLQRIFRTWYKSIKHINIDIWKKLLWLCFPIDGHIWYIVDEPLSNQVWGTPPSFHRMQPPRTSSDVDKPGLGFHNKHNYEDWKWQESWW